jgi:ethanolaminephosphotransferase
LKMGHYISEKGVESLKSYKYSGVDRSYVAKYILQPYWRWCVNFFPEWMPPNGITLMGFSFIILSSLLSYIYSPTLDYVVPAWVSFAHGLLLFLYQTFDAVDGKQARRTGSSSPLGELFDHGCDALTCAFETMAFGCTVMSGKWTLWFWAIAIIPFYGATWESFFTDTLILPEINGPTEGLMLIYGVHFFTSIVGTSWWTLNFRVAVPLLRFIPFLPDMPAYIFTIWFMLIATVTPTFAYNVYNVSKVVKARGESMTTALAMLFPFVVLLGSVTTWALLSPSDILATQPHLVLIGAGCSFGYMVGRLVLAHLTVTPKGLKTGMCKSLVFLPFAIGNALSAQVLGGKPLVNEFVVLLAFVAFEILLYLRFASGVINEISTALGIYCFQLGKRNDKKVE